MTAFQGYPVGICRMQDKVDRNENLMRDMDRTLMSSLLECSETFCRPVVT